MAKTHQGTESTVETAYAGFLKIERHRIARPELPAPITREVMVRGPAACVLVIDPQARRALLVEEFRIGVHVAGFPTPSRRDLAPIAGMVESGASPQETIAREAFEEAGLDLSNFRIIGPLSTFPSPGGSSEVVHHFVAFGPLDDALQDARFGLASEGEATIVRLVPLEALGVSALRDGPPVSGLLTTCLLLAHTDGSIR